MKNRSRRKTVKYKQWQSNKYFYDMLAFFLPIMIMLVAYVAMGVFPFGEKATMIIDSYHQYVPFFSELHDKIWHGDSLLYSWHGSLGFNFLTVQAYYLASPLNLLIAVFPASLMIEAFECLIILKIALSGWTASRYLRRRTGKNNLATVVFAEFYALGGFTLAYNWNVMWLDCIFLFPLVLMGAEKLINEKDGRLYTIALGLSIFCNYYMAIMVCIFMVLYFFVIWFSKKRTGIAAFLKTGVHYAISSVLAAGMACIYLVPTYYTLINSSQGSKPTELKFYRSVFDLVKQQFALVEPTQLTGAPNIYCGIFICILVLLYIVARGISKREKVTRLLVAAFMLASLNINYLDYVWHGFHFPNNLPGRFSFIYIFMMVVMAYDAFNVLKEINVKWYIAAMAVSAAGYAACLFLAEETIENYTLIVTGAFILAYFLLLFAWREKSIWTIKKWQINLQYVVLFLMMTELTANSIYGLCMNGTTNRTSYLTDRAEIAEIRDEYEAADVFYRMEIADIHARDEVTWHHLNGLSFFSSTADDRLEKLTGALGFYNAGNKYSYKGATPLTDAMFGIKYIISGSEMAASNLTLVQQTETKYIYENTQNLSLGYMVDPMAADWQIVEGDPFNTQNDFVRMATGTENLLYQNILTGDPEMTGGTVTSTAENTWYYDADKTSGKLTWTMSFAAGEDVYVYFEASHCDNLKVISGDDTETYTDERGHIVHVSGSSTGEPITFEFNMNNDYSSGNVKFQVYTLNQEVEDLVYQRLASNQLQVTSFDATHVAGTIDVDQAGIMMLSVPYDEGWTISVDGQVVDKVAIGEALMGCEMTPGTHTVSLKYCPQGFKTGALMSILSIVVILLYCFKNQLGLPKKKADLS